jgi:hypothetical protein
MRLWHIQKQRWSKEKYSTKLTGGKLSINARVGHLKRFAYKKYLSAQARHELVSLESENLYPVCSSFDKYMQVDCFGAKA